MIFKDSENRKVLLHSMPVHTILNAIIKLIMGSRLHSGPVAQQKLWSGFAGQNTPILQ
jgi:hypothetical protein